jgi:tetratricopeptide (TPR) repeat protein
VLAARKKISKKQMKEDKLVTTYYKFQNIFLENQTRILIGLGVIAVVVVAIILYTNKKSNDNQAAATLLSKVLPIYEAGNYKDAINGQAAGNIIGLKKIVDDYSGTEHGEAARIFLANAYSLIGDNNSAYNAYDNYSGSNSLFKATALVGKAGMIEAKKEYENAADLYLEASKIDKTNPSNAEFMMKAGIAYLKVGNKEKAKFLFETIKKDYKNLVTFLEVDKYLSQTEL